MREPRDPLLKVVLIACDHEKDILYTTLEFLCENADPLRKERGPRGDAQRGVGEMDVRERSSVHDL